MRVCPFSPRPTVLIGVGVSAMVVGIAADSANLGLATAFFVLDIVLSLLPTARFVGSHELTALDYVLAVLAPLTSLAFVTCLMGEYGKQWRVHLVLECFIGILALFFK